MAKRYVEFFVGMIIVLMNAAQVFANSEPGIAVKPKHYEGIFGMCGYRIPLERRLKAYERTFRNSPWVNGIMIIEPWQNIQPKPGEFDWSEVDALIELAARYNRKVSLFFISAHAPEWIYKQGTPKLIFTDKNPRHKEHGQKRIIPVPVSEKFYTLWSGFIREAGKRYDPNPTVAAVVITGVNFQSGETYIPLNSADEIEQARKYGINPENVLLYWKKYIDVYAQAFPNTKCKLHIAEMFRNDHAVLDNVVAYGTEKYPAQFQIQMNKLNGKRDLKGQHEYDLVMRYSSKIGAGFQMLSSFKDKERQGPMAMALMNGMRAGARYYELWFGDATDPLISKKFYSLWQEARQAGWERLPERVETEGEYQESAQQASPEEEQCRWRQKQWLKKRWQH